MNNVNENVIHITECDNQLTIVAVSSDQMTMYELVQVGAGMTVDVKVKLVRGNYSANPSFLADSTPVTKTVSLPADTYTIYYTGFNAGGPYNYAFTLNNHPFVLKNDPAKPLYGYIWNRGGSEPSDITVTIA